ncbi:helix-turn-helix transcriptional regulator [Kocuria sp. M1N1S27]|uniref:helix-turn-helix transcriptional regulator n=1 Tax=Kocuria kalidii TaxID=3376283 RepID=UPI0037928368
MNPPPYPRDLNAHDDARFAESVKRLREERGWSQGELARQLLAAGMEGFHQTTVSRIEKGERPVRLGEARALARVFDTSVDRMVAPEPREKYIRGVEELFAKVGEDVRQIEAAVKSLTQVNMQLEQAVSALGEIDDWADPELEERARGQLILAEAHFWLPLEKGLCRLISDTINMERDKLNGKHQETP